MKTNFSLEISGHQLELENVNISGPKLFHVYVAVEGKKERYHLAGNGTDPLSFANPHDCPAFLLEIEQELSAEIFRLHQQGDQ